jgi:predicted AlkP superfamily pyrophosphatase or phosphodiesterase
MTCRSDPTGAMHVGLTPRPQYKADGRKLPDCYAVPASLRDELNVELGPFPLFQFWGPATDISSSRWIAEATKHVVAQSSPSLTLVYLPHLDYDMQRHGPDEGHPRVATSLREIDGVAGDLIGFAEQRGCSVVVLSEYGISRVDTPIHINRALSEAPSASTRGWTRAARPGDISALRFRPPDAHYVQSEALIEPVRRIVQQLPGVEDVLDREGQKGIAIDHPRSGELVALAARNAWFTYYYWLDDARAPDFARTVEIHRKPGYDPVELFIDPAIRFPKLAIGSRLARRWMGQRALMDVIPLDASLVRGSHGRIARSDSDGPIFISSDRRAIGQDIVSALDVKGLILDHVFSGR